jgi:hypothetical protein
LGLHHGTKRYCHSPSHGTQLLFHWNVLLLNAIPQPPCRFTPAIRACYGIVTAMQIIAAQARHALHS